MDKWEFSKPIYTFCPNCGDKAWISEDHKEHDEKLKDDFVQIGGILVVNDFITADEENELISLIDTQQPWVPSQEGRLKQDYGPKVSFLKQKASLGEFRGFPDFATQLFNKIQSEHPNAVSEFVPVEFCCLDYSSDRKSFIRQHFDDFWIWGDRLITVNLLSDTVLRLTREFNQPPIEIGIKMPTRSLVIISGEARYNWQHGIRKFDIKSRRVACTWREFGDEILKDSEYADFIEEVFMVAQGNPVV